MSLFIIKLISSAIAVTVITEIAKKHAPLAGLIAAMPINILLCLLWLYIEKKDLTLLSSFTHSAIIGLIPTVIFLLSVYFLLKKQWSFAPALLAGLLILVTGSFFHQRFVN